MPILAPSRFVANAQATIELGRDFTAEEDNTLRTIKITATNNGEQTSPTDQVTPGTYVSYYSTLATAQAVVAAANAFTPAPISATATSI
jgi:hypothetical protein